MTRRTRRLRHWKQRFDPNAKFIWRTSKLWDGKMTVPGEEVDPEFAANKRNRNKLRNLWESGMIELAEFKPVKDVTTGEREADEPVSNEPVAKAEKLAKEKWVATNDLEGETFKTKKAAEAWYDELAAKAEEVLDDDTPFETETDETETDETETDETEDPDFLN